MKKALIALALFALAVVAALGGMSLLERSPEVHRPSAYKGMSDEEILTLRSESRWAALIGKDMVSVHGYATPSYRKTYDHIHLSNQYAFQVQRKSANVERVELESNDEVALVWVRLWYETSGFTPNEKLTLDSQVKETWRKVDDMWWYVEPN